MPRPPAKDVAIAVLTAAATLGLLATQGFGSPTGDVRTLDLAGVVLGLLASLPLAATGRFALTAYAIVSVATLVMIGLDYPVDLPFGPLVGAYSLAVAYAGDGRRSRRSGALASVVLFVPAVVGVLAVGGEDVAAVLPGLVGWFLLLVGVWITGDRTQLRAARYAELRSKAERAEREAERERRLAAAEERTRIARELHDSAGHAMNVILVQAGAARLLRELDPERSRKAIETVEHVARETIAEIDRLVRALREEEGAPRIPAHPDALEELIAQHREAGLDLAVDVRGAPVEVPRSVAWAAYRIVQEALTNAARHGRGRADVVLRYDPAALRIDVANAATPNGNGSLGGGHGLVGMRERATLLGGRFETETTEGMFRLRAWLPYGDVAT